MSTDKNTVVISKQPGNRISLAVPWNEEVIRYFKTIDQRKWCKDNKEWSFPSTSLESIKSRLEQIYKVVVRENQPSVHILELKGSHSEVSSEYDPDIMRIIEEVPLTYWDSMKRAFMMPNEHVFQFCKTLDHNHISFDTSCPPEPKTFKTNNKKLFDSQYYHQ